MTSATRVLLTALCLALLALAPACGEADSNAEPDGDLDSAGETDAEPDGEALGEIETEEETDAEAESPWPTVEPKMETRGLYTLIWLKGTPYEMGYQQGQFLHDIIGEAVEFVNNDTIMKWVLKQAKSMGILDIARANSYPDVLDECQGLVDATADVGMTMDHCLTLNFGDVMIEFIMGGMPEETRRKIDPGPGCSELIVSGDATPDGKLYHARNLDWGSMDISLIHGHPIIFIRQPAGGIPHLYVGFPMNISPYTAMNAAGISICSNEADPAGPEEQALTGRSHVQMFYMAIKSYGSLSEINDFLMNEPGMTAEILVVADGNTREGAVFEMTAAHRARRNPTGGLLYETNHFIAPEMDAYDLPQDIEAGDSSLLRYERLAQLTEPGGEESRYGHLNPEGLAGVMRDRVNPRTGIEAPDSPDQYDNDAGIATNGPMHFVLFDPARKLMWVAAGQEPIYNQPYECFSLGELIGLPDAETCDVPQY